MYQKNTPEYRNASQSNDSTQSKTKSGFGTKRSFLESKPNFESEINVSLFSDDEDTKEIPARIKQKSPNIDLLLEENSHGAAVNSMNIEESKLSIGENSEKKVDNKIYLGTSDKIVDTTFLGYFTLEFYSCDENWKKISTKDRLLLIGERDNFNVFEVWLNKSLLGYVKKDLTFLARLSIEEIVQCVVTKNSTYEVLFSIYLGKKEKLPEDLDKELMSLDEEENESDWKKASPMVAWAKELLEKMMFSPSAKALIENIAPKMDFSNFLFDSQKNLLVNSSPEFEQKNFTSNIYDPFAKATWEELENEKKQFGKINSDMQNVADIFEGFAYEEDIDKISSISVSKDKEFDPKKEADIQFRKEQIVFKTLELNKLKFKEIPRQMSCKLRDYQKNAVNWMLSQEGKFPELHDILQPKDSKRLMHPLCEEWTSPAGLRLYLNIYNGLITDLKPKLPFFTKGGILADDMGLGKTVMMIGLFLSNSREKLHSGLNNFATDEQLLNSDSSDSEILSSDPIEPPIKRAKVNQQNSMKPESQKLKITSTANVCMGGNLIICPPILRSQWYSEISRHTKQNSLTVLLYEGSNKKIKEEDIIKYDAVIASYRLLGEELRRKNSKLLNIFWHRVVLDEAHVTRNKKACWSQAVFKLQAKYRWVLTGTPTQNRFQDLFSLLHFLRIDPWGLKHSYWTGLMNHVQQNQKIEYLHSVLKPIMLRRTKESLSIVDKKDIDLPPKFIETKLIVLDKNERDFYENCKTTVHKQYVTLAEKQETNKYNMYFTLYQNLMQLRRTCDHKLLISMSIGNPIKQDLDEKLKKFLEERGIFIDFEQGGDIPEVQKNVSVKALKSRIEDLKNDQIDDCPVCRNPPEALAFTVCGHIFCEECISTYLDKNQSCPNCRRNIEKNDVLIFYRHPLKLSIETYKPSSKSGAVIEAILSIAQKNEKCICFTQWMGMMDILGFEMELKGIKFLRLDGSCSNKKRTKILTQFLEDQETTVLMISLMLGGVGLNLTRANHVLLVEPWWNPGVEIQAIERVHRIGQNKPVYVTKFICKDTIEENMVQLQERKKGILNLVLAQNSKEAISNFKYLLGILEQPLFQPE